MPVPSYARFTNLTITDGGAVFGYTDYEVYIESSSVNIYVSSPQGASSVNGTLHGKVTSVSVGDNATYGCSTSANIVDTVDTIGGMNSYQNSSATITTGQPQPLSITGQLNVANGSTIQLNATSAPLTFSGNATANAGGNFNIYAIIDTPNTDAIMNSLINNGSGYANITISGVPTPDTYVNEIDQLIIGDMSDTGGSATIYYSSGAGLSEFAWGFDSTFNYADSYTDGNGWTVYGTMDSPSTTTIAARIATDMSNHSSGYPFNVTYQSGSVIQTTETNPSAYGYYSNYSGFSIVQTGSLTYGPATVLTFNQNQVNHN